MHYFAVIKLSLSGCPHNKLFGWRPCFSSSRRSSQKNSFLIRLKKKKCGCTKQKGLKTKKNGGVLRNHGLEEEYAPKVSKSE